MELKCCVKSIDLGDKSITMRVIEDLEPLLEQVKVDDDIPFWAELWPSALGLARFLWQKIELQGKSTLELGAGLGLPGITAALKGAQVVETDLVADSLEWARANAQLNGLFDLKYLTADWRDFRVAGKYEVILGSDVLYEPKLHPMLEHILEAYLLPWGRAYLADPGREGASTFLALLTGKGWIVNSTEVTVEMDKYRSSINLYSLQKEGTE